MFVNDEDVEKQNLLQCARQGFALGLDMLVGAVPNIAVDSVLKLIVDLLEVSSSMKGQVRCLPVISSLYECVLTCCLSKDLYLSLWHTGN